ncbi:helix-turn-helix domain-containing protein [Lactiplantibacillus plantarum]|uniref:helix-turn-helix domain-containing protein n=1 Tax=Lactiplantibacillus plantarum TaxID=1590 RepID=UPI001BADB352|nr:helix-turn-helix transcriptional regulator [Lactiplantibacillus plantarum]MBS0954987.1 helix-turn-helix transcriptional regulator [Lactiplantibacillus plantarum]
MINLFGKIIRNKRKKSQLTIEELAEKANVSISYLAKLERGELTDTSYSRLNRVLRELDLNFTDVLQSQEPYDSDLAELIHVLKTIPTKKRAKIISAILQLLKD